MGLILKQKVEPTFVVLLSITNDSCKRKATSEGYELLKKLVSFEQLSVV